ncbi:MAG: SRPBCC family protein [Rhizobiales bacterium]|nr:SRPBCC family protein [Hyphomicrobiales bacterium]
MSSSNDQPVEFTLEIERIITAPRDVVWRCWTQPDLLMQWYCPAPWKVTHADINLKVGGRMNCIMEGPNDGERHEIVGMLLEVVPKERLTFTDGYSEGFIPRANPFMTGYVRLSDQGARETKMVWGARHTSEEDKQKHLEMGFEQGWNAAAGQLNELAKKIASTS